MGRWRTTVGRRSAILLLSLAAAACRGEREPAHAPEGADALSGEWTVELVLTDPLLPRGTVQPPPVARGTLSLLRDDRVRRVEGLHGPPTHVGVHTLGLSGFGFEMHPAGRVPAVAARWAPPDSVELAFESAAAASELLGIRGRLRGDSVVGRWHYTTRVSGAAGRVVMRRAAAGAEVTRP